MALYAFDGTWNKDKPGTERDTNVLWFSTAYVGNKFYQKGIGTRVGKVGKIVGGITGAGGRSRVRKARRRLEANFNRGDTTIDIVGFSRGAALALHFANKIASKGVETRNGKVFPKIRFLGLWDTVAAFGAPDVPANIGWKLKVPPAVERCYHALSLDERRHAFKPERMKPRGKGKHPGVIEECWFRGVHSDVGGGNKNTGLSSCALDWMFAKAKQAGIQLDPKVVARNRTRKKPKAQITVRKRKLGKSRFRRVRPGDRVHQTVQFRADSPEIRHNNPPDGAPVVTNTGKQVRSFKRA